jgi:hypothetical protein
MSQVAVLVSIAIVVASLSSSSSCYGVLANYASKNRNPPPAAQGAVTVGAPVEQPPAAADAATKAPKTKAPKVVKAAKPGDTVAKGGGAPKGAAPIGAPPAGGGKVVDAKARVTYYRPGDNDPPGSRNCAYKNPCTSPDQGSPSSAAHAANGSSPYKKGGLYTISGAGKPPFCVRIDDTCAACKGSWIDIFLENGQKLPFDYAKVSEGC